MPQRPTIVFDVNETLSDMAPMAERFVEVGLPAEQAALWFASVLRDGFALSISGTPQPFVRVAGDLLRGMLPQDAGDAAVQHVLDGFGALAVHPDVADGIRSLAAAGITMVTLTNGATAVADGLLTRAGVRELVSELLTVDDAPAWKPDPRSYTYAAQHLALAPRELMLVAVHPWDIHGAHAAGLQTAFVDRGRAYPDVFAAPDRTVTGIGDLAAQLT